MSKLILSAIVAVFTLLGYLLSQEQTITGKVTSREDGSPLPGVNVVLKGTSLGTTTDQKGEYTLTVPDSRAVLVFSFIGYATREVKVLAQTRIDIKLTSEVKALAEVTKAKASRKKQEESTVRFTPPEAVADEELIEERTFLQMAPPPVMANKHRFEQPQPEFNTESYNAIHENSFLEATKNPLSTFSIDVDAASYANIRRFISQGQQPPKDAVRIEEMVNYFTYDYPQPAGEVPFSVNTELSQCPWNADHRLLHIGLQGRKIPTENLPPSNLVFLVDVSGSMQDPNKLPLVKSALSMLVEQLRPQDHVALVVYAGAAGLVLPSTPGSEKTKIMEALSQLEAGGSTAGGAGIKLAYAVAQEHLKKEGNNRVILATDGDFNVGASSDAEMERLIEEKRKSGVFLTVTGFGMGNYKDSKMETLADKGNGNYAYIDNLQEARKVMVNEFGGTLFTIAKDVKLQLEFNPAKVKAYRLIGYENRVMKNEEFNDDQKDAGELGSGHTVTALYEIIPAGSTEEVAGVDKLKYQKTQIDPKAYHTEEVVTIKLRFKQPNGDKSQLLQKAVLDRNTPLNQTSDNFRFSAAVAEFGLLLRESEWKGKANLGEVIALATGARGKDTEGYRIDFINLVKSSQFLQARK